MECGVADRCHDEQPEFKLNTGWVYDSGIWKFSLSVVYGEFVSTSAFLRSFWTSDCIYRPWNIVSSRFTITRIVFNVIYTFYTGIVVKVFILFECP